MVDRKTCFSAAGLLLSLFLVGCSPEPESAGVTVEADVQEISVDDAWTKYAAKPKGDALAIIGVNLKSWSPVSVEVNDGVLLIALPHRRVTDQIYHAVIQSGVCSSLWLSSNHWDGVEEVRVLNESRAQGYIFEGGERECAVMGNMPDTGLFIAGKTRLL